MASAKHSETEKPPPKESQAPKKRKAKANAGATDDAPAAKKAKVVESKVAGAANATETTSTKKTGTSNHPETTSTKKTATVFVRGMAKSFDREALKTLFAKWGEISEFNVPMRKAKPNEARKGREPVSRGIAFIQFASHKGAKRALKLHKTEFAGEELHVTMSKAQQPTEEPKDSKKTASKQDNTLFVTNLPHKSDEAKIKAHFRECGNIAGCRILLNKGIAFIRYKRAEGFQKGLELDGQEFSGRVINVAKADSNSAKVEKSDDEE